MSHDSDEALDGACSEIRAALPLFAGRDLDPDEQETVQRHLDGCPACSLSLAPWVEARGTLAAERARQERQPSPSLWEGVRADLVREGLVRPEPALPSASRRRPAALRALAAAAAVVLAVVLTRPDGPGALPQPAGASPSEPAVAAAAAGAGGPAVLAEEPALLEERGAPEPNLLADAPREQPAPGRLRPLAPGDRGLAEDAVEILHTLPLRPGAAAAGSPLMLTSGQ
jgi:hypothetical protein